MVAGELRDRLARASFELEPAHPRFATRTRSSPHSSGASGVTLDTTPVPKKQRGAWILRRSTESAPRGPVTLAPWVGRRSGRETRCSRRWWPEASTLLSARSTTRRGWAHHPRAVCLLCAARRKSAPLRAYSRGRGGWGVGPIAIFMEWGCPTDRAMGPGGQGSHRHTRPVGPASTREGTSRGALATTMSRTRRSLRASKQRSRGSSERSRICEEQV